MGDAASSPYTTHTSASGWVATNSLLLQGGPADGNPVFSVFGDASNYAVCLNGKSGSQGVLTSPSIANGLGTLKFDYCLPYSDNQVKLTINIKQDGKVVATDVLENKGMTKLQKYEYSHAFNIAGNFCYRDCQRWSVGFLKQQRPHSNLESDLDKQINQGLTISFYPVYPHSTPARLSGRGAFV